MPVGFVHDDIYQLHDTRDHIEGRDRLTAVMTALKKTKVKDQLTHLLPRAATID